MSAIKTSRSLTSHTRHSCLQTYRTFPTDAINSLHRYQDRLNRCSNLEIVLKVIESLDRVLIDRVEPLLEGCAFVGVDLLLAHRVLPWWTEWNVDHWLVLSDPAQLARLGVKARREWTEAPALRRLQEKEHEARYLRRANQWQIRTLDSLVNHGIGFAFEYRAKSGCNRRVRSIVR